MSHLWLGLFTFLKMWCYCVTALMSPNNGVFTGVFSCWHVACEDAGWAEYSQLRLHVTGEYNCQQAVSWYQLLNCYQTTEHVSHHPVYTQRVSLLRALAFAKVSNFERVAGETQREHATAFSHLHERCW